MKIIVQKYGGTSVGTAERIKNVAQRIALRRNDVDALAVVVSAMGNETDRLLSLARNVADFPSLREQDVLLASGEQVSAALLAISLAEHGIKARSFLSFQLPIITDKKHAGAQIKEINISKLLQSFQEGEVAVVAGFQGITPGCEITTLGRGGSDTTAVGLAAALNANYCEIYTDVEGVYTCDPKVYVAARKLKRISYESMMELAGLGAKVLHHRCVDLARKYNVKILICSSFNNAEGTWVCEEDEKMEGTLISGVTYSRGEAKISVLGVPDKPGIASLIFIPLAEMGINVDMIIQNISRQNTADLTFTIPAEELEKALYLVTKAAHEIGAEGVHHDRHIAKISVVGGGMRSNPGVAARMFQTLAREGINIMMISTSEIKISCVIDARYTELAVRALHDAFNLGV
ncbi:MAG TPA: aspartate kinase [Firmicutes bacterium]|nr:aspartate kinase [Bacillota bacterium]